MRQQRLQVQTLMAQVQPPPGPDGQQAQPRYAHVLAPVLPMMMPYGMMPYAPPAAMQFPLQQPEPMQFTAQAPPVPPAQANNPINNIFAGVASLPVTRYSWRCSWVRSDHEEPELLLKL